MTYETLNALFEKKSPFEDVLSDARNPADAALQDAKKLATVLKAQCGPWLNEVGTEVAFRGSDNHSSYEFGEGWRAKRRAIRHNRRPMSSSSKQHKALDASIKKAGLVANRTNSIFVTGDPDHAGQYGNLALIFPVGKFNYTWSATMRDAYHESEALINRDPADQAYLELEQLWDLPHTTKWVAQVHGKKVAVTGVDYTRVLKLHKNLANITEITVEGIPKDSRDLLKKRLQHPEVMEWAVKIMKRDAKLTGISDNKQLTALLWLQLAVTSSSDSKQEYKRLAKALTSAITADSKANPDTNPLKWQGDDGSLPKALRSGNEVMIHASDAIYVNPAFFRYMVQPILSGRDIKDVQAAYKKYLRAAEDDDYSY